jgi:hypothetical protein
MGIGDIFKTKKIEELSARVAELEKLLTPEVLEYDQLLKLIADKKAELAALEDRISADEKAAKAKIEELEREISGLQGEIDADREALVQLDEEVLMQSFGLYQPRYDFASSTDYKDALMRVRAEQKDMIKSDSAASGSTTWTVNGSEAKGKKLVNDTKKLLLRAFNSECDDAVEHVKFNNFDAAKKKIEVCASTISKLGKTMNIQISPVYINLKIQELQLAHEFRLKKQEEKDRLRELRAEERERAKLEKEIEEARKKVEKEQAHYTNALLSITKQLASASEEDRAALEAKKVELEAQLKELDKSLEQIDYRAANQKAGYVYIISNIGAFGENVYKIGMTRRLEPMDRVDELGDASVPFNFDVHALIFSEDAPALEAALHRAFEDRKVNMVNTRREFFNVSIDEIKKVVKENYDKTVEFTDVAPAEQFRESILMRKEVCTVG